jgi:RimJ/RimL family protein N-acetyltransferase
VTGDREQAIRLEPFGPGRIEEIRPWLEDPDVLRFTRIPDPQPPKFLEGWLRSYEVGRRSGTREAFWVIDAGEALVGLAVVPKIDTETRTAELGYMVAPGARGRGIATAALGLLSAWAFSERGMVRLELLIGIGNMASKRVAASNGYTFEGILRSLYFKQGRHEDTEIWSRLATDPDGATAGARPAQRRRISRP